MSVEMVVKKKGDDRHVRVFSLLAAAWTICSVAWLMKRQPEKKALLLTLYESVYERASLAAIRAASEHAAKRKSTGCALRLIVSPFTNKLSRVNPETREII